MVRPNTKMSACVEHADICLLFAESSIRIGCKPAVTQWFIELGHHLLECARARYRKQGIPMLPPDFREDYFLTKGRGHTTAFLYVLLLRKGGLM